MSFNQSTIDRLRQKFGKDLLVLTPEEIDQIPHEDLDDLFDFFKQEHRARRGAENPNHADHASDEREQAALANKQRRNDEYYARVSARELQRKKDAIQPLTHEEQKVVDDITKRFGSIERLPDSAVDQLTDDEIHVVIKAVRWIHGKVKYNL